MDFFLCKPCHAIEAAKGCQVYEKEEEELVRSKPSSVRLKKIVFENAGEYCNLHFDASISMKSEVP